ncbi:MAG TPA: WYL domain-containing protein [Pseudobacteroides sp.]|uniref:WYL domain-containing protein n=1 Tax=Pseudobacteroides sp. TaxID=1968840 RepID=UPI002F94780F
MELFSEVKNRYFQLVLRIINECAEGKAKSEILKIIDEGEFEQKVIGKKQQSFADIMLNRCDEGENLYLLAHKDGQFYPALEGAGSPPVPVRFTILEKFWLKALLENEGVRMVLSHETYEKLKRELGGVESPIKDEYIEMTNTIKLPEIAEQEAYSRNFRLILKALVDKKAIRYTNTDKRGNVYRDKLALPVGIEYSARDGRFRVSMYSIDDNRPIMANIFTLSELRIVDEDVGMDRETAKRLLFEQKYSSEPIILEVIDKKAAMERCFMCFSGMERTARDLGDNKYEIKLNYYLFEEENLIRNIISLGPYVKVISPQRMVDEIVKRVKKSLSLYSL